MDKPPEALTKTEYYKTTITTITYAVYSDTHPFFNCSGHISKFIRDGNQNINPGWFDGTIGYLFDNYFHALAYSLKVKANLKEKDNA